MKSVFQSTLAHGSQQVCAQLEGVGFHPQVVGAQSSGLNLVAGGLESVLVPEDEFEAASTYLLEAKIVLDTTTASGVVPEGAVCPVHEQSAVASCDRCGTFLCAGCGSLGTPPLCEECVGRPEDGRPHPLWVKNTARVWVGWWVGTALIGGVLALLGRLFQ